MNLLERHWCRKQAEWNNQLTETEAWLAEFKIASFKLVFYFSKPLCSFHFSGSKSVVYSLHRAVTWKNSTLTSFSRLLLWF